jgi:hypothetical protein
MLQASSTLASLQGWGAHFHACIAKVLTGPHKQAKITSDLAKVREILKTKIQLRPGDGTVLLKFKF